MSRRGSNIYKRKDGRWEGRIVKESGRNGMRRYSSVYGKNYNEVKTKLDLFRKTYNPQGEPVKGTLADVMDIWLREKGPSWKKTTYAVYCQTIDKYILPRLGEVKANEIDDGTLEAFAGSIRDEAGEGCLSDRYLRSICGVALRALRYVKKKYHYAIEIPENLIIPAKRGQVTLPGGQDMAALEKYLLENAEDDTCLGILIVFYTGIRIGEACALTWGDVDLKEGIIYVRKNLQRVKTSEGQKNSTEILLQTPKTRTSFRMIPIPPVLFPLLRQYKKEDVHYIIKGKKKAWVEPRTLQYRFARILDECGIKSFNFHMLRHAFASRCIDKGFDAKSLSEILGHSSVQVTLNLYVHSSLQHKKELMEKFDICCYQSKAMDDA